MIRNKIKISIIFSNQNRKELEQHLHNINEANKKSREIYSWKWKEFLLFKINYRCSSLTMATALLLSRLYLVHFLYTRVLQTRQVWLIGIVLSVNQYFIVAAVVRFNVHWNRRSFLCARLFHIRKLNVLLFICSTGTFCKCQNHTKHINSDSFVDEMRKCVWLHLCAQMWKINGNQQMRKSTERQRENRKFPLEEKNALEIYMWQSISGNVLFFDEFWFCCTSCNSVLTDWTRNKYPTTAEEVLMYLKCIHKIILEPGDGEFSV